ncbi:hypothetical protein XA68_14504 [Ophiocordyceps unilateralis]|uniref:IGFBP N-terminal domain-containing protein n=1 Tax=Ophiocordyceps unilateralis TaxID=268505 RepID=A0A2A9PL51_OPHUN|nr:hypothetical protein XA68_14504 [Ophiocordyceps unilateralis]
MKFFTTLVFAGAAVANSYGGYGEDTCKKEGQSCNTGVAPEYGCCEALQCVTPPGAPPGAQGVCKGYGGQSGPEPYPQPEPYPKPEPTCKKEGNSCNAGVALEYGCCGDLECYTPPGAPPGAQGVCRKPDDDEEEYTPKPPPPPQCAREGNECNYSVTPGSLPTCCPGLKCITPPGSPPGAPGKCLKEESYSGPQPPSPHPQPPSPHPQKPSSYPQPPSPHPQEPSSYPQPPSPHPQEPSSYPQSPSPHPQHPSPEPKYSSLQPQHPSPQPQPPSPHPDQCVPEGGHCSDSLPPQECKFCCAGLKCHTPPGSQPGAYGTCRRPDSGESNARVPDNTTYYVSGAGKMTSGALIIGLAGATACFRLGLC